MQVKDTVTWTSSAGGYRKTKTGIIVEVVPAGVDPLKITMDIGYPGLPRRHESYLVLVGKKLY